MDLRKFGLGALLAAALSLPGAVSALTIDGITIAPGALLETIDLFEGERVTGGPITASGQELVGIGIVNRILDSNNNTIWQNGDNGRELTLYFYNYISEDFSTTGAVTPGLDTITFSGGRIDLYSQVAGTFSFAGTMMDGIDSATAGNLWLSLEGSPIGGFGLVSGNEITLRSTAVRLDDPNPFQSANSIFGTGLLDVVGGPAAQFFDTNTFECGAGASAPCPQDADIAFTSSGQIPVVPGTWAFRGTGEVQSFVQIPEPGTMALLGLGLAGLGFAARRRVKAA